MGKTAYEAALQRIDELYPGVIRRGQEHYDLTEVYSDVEDRVEEDQTLKDTVMMTDMRLPFDVMSIEILYMGVRLLLMISEVDDHNVVENGVRGKKEGFVYVTYQVFKYTNKGSGYWPAIGVKFHLDGDCSISLKDETIKKTMMLDRTFDSKEKVEDMYYHLVGLVYKSMFIIKNSHACVYGKPTFSQKNRLTKLQYRGDRYKVVTKFLNPKELKSKHGKTGLGGYKVREHPVSGHERHYKSGKVVWIKPHKRGSALIGRVFKTFKIKHEPDNRD